MKTLIFLLSLISIPAFSSPLEPIKLDSPRDTFASYLSAIKAGKVDEAARTFNLSEIPLLARREKARETAILLKEVVDRVIIVDLAKVPEDSSLDRWRLKDTEIIISKVKEGDNAGEFLFSKDTVYRMEEFYKKVRHLPYLEGSDGGAGYNEPFVDRHVPDSWRSDFLGVEKWKYLGIFLAIFIGLIIKSLVAKIIHLIKNLTSRKEDTARHQVVVAVEQPAGLIAATAFWFFCIQFMKFDGKFLSFLMGMVQVVLSLALVWAAYRLTGVFSDYLKRLADKTETDLDDHLVPLLAKSLRVFVLVIGVLVTIQNLGFNVMSLLAGLGLGGLAFALAAKDTAANLFGSLMILFDRPFKIGDWIVTGSAEGTVEEIGFRSTRIRTFYNSQVSIPNSALANQNIDNMGRRRYRRVKANLGLTYSTSPDKLHDFIEGVREILRGNEYIWQDNFHVYFNSYGDSSLNVLLYCFLQTPDWSTELAQKDKIYTGILNLSKKVGVDFAFPSQSIYVEQLPQ